eukprot:GSMAST32.ASY1.ANO1.1092.1 assembled CDS
MDSDIPWWLEARSRAPKSYWYLVVAVVAFYILYLYTAVFVCIEPLFPNGGKVELLIVLATLVLLSGTSYVRALTTNPGVVRRVQAEPGQVDAARPALLDYQKVNYCAICDLYKPPRTHHCRRCNRCVMKMDHHCLWINNCVGFYNHKYFFLFVLYSWLSFFGLFVLYCYRWVLFILARLHSNSHSKVDYIESTSDLVLLGVSTLLIIGHIITVGYMLGFHIFLISKGRTNVEQSCCQGNAAGCNFNMGSVFNNWKAAFGENIIDWMIPTKPPLDRPMWDRRRRSVQQMNSNSGLANPVSDILGSSRGIFENDLSIGIKGNYDSHKVPLMAPAPVPTTGSLSSTP